MESTYTNRVSINRVLGTVGYFYLVTQCGVSLTYFNSYFVAVTHTVSDMSSHMRHVISSYVFKLFQVAVAVARPSVRCEVQVTNVDFD